MRLILRPAGFAFFAFLALLRAGPASAQMSLPLTNWQYSAGQVLAPLAGEIPKWRVSLGASTSLQPQYQGSQRYIVEPGPLIDLHYRDRAFFTTGEGLGYNLLRGKTWRAGVALGFDLGRDQDLNSRLRGLGDVDPAPEARIFAEYFILPVVISVDLRRALGGSDGLIGDIGGYVPIPLPFAEKAFLFVGPSVTFADSQYMQSYFGVGPDQAARSRFSRFDAGAGIKNANFGVSGVWFFTDHWFLNGDLAYERFLGDAADSPIVESKSQFAAVLSLGYKF